MQGGIKSIRNFINSCVYNVDIAIKDSAKAAYMAACILNNQTAIQRFDNTRIPEIKSKLITKLNTRLNKMKKSNIEAFYYWALVEELQD